MCKRRLVNILMTLAVAATAEACRTKLRQFEVAFWAGTGAERDPRVISVREHGLYSGNVAIAQVTHMPPPKDIGALRPELVVELSSSGVILHRWSLPVDGIVVAVSNDQLIVPRGDTKPGAEALSISSSGDLDLTKVPEKTDRNRLADCPKIPEFNDSDYVGCFEFKDITSGQLRRIVYQQPCT